MKNVIAILGLILWAWAMQAQDVIVHSPAHYPKNWTAAQRAAAIKDQRRYLDHQTLKTDKPGACTVNTDRCNPVYFHGIKQGKAKGLHFRASAPQAPVQPLVQPAHGRVAPKKMGAK